MKVLMFGWEFPPYNSGGLGTACYGLTKGLAQWRVRVAFVIPRSPGKVNAEYVKLLCADEIDKMTLHGISSPLSPYMTPEEYSTQILEASPSKAVGNLYGRDLFAEVHRYAAKGALLAQNTPHDVIHAHDWLTYKAGMAAKRISGKPLIVHVHATEFDRTGGNGVHQQVYDIEREGMHAAERILAVSQFTKNKIIEHYGISPDKITVVHNAVEFTNNTFAQEELRLREKEKVVLFLGRITLQKGPDYFLSAAKKVADCVEKVTFVVAGSGDMQPFLINKAAQLGIGDRVLFTGFLRGKDVDKAYQMADLYVMPSVSEPFGITPLEAMRNDVPVIISNQSGVSEVINHCLKVDFWDVDELASKMISVLEYPELHHTMQQFGKKEVHTFNWKIPAEKCLRVYKQVQEQAISI
jgi:glycogen synthase